MTSLRKALIEPMNVSEQFVHGAQSAKIVPIGAVLRSIVTRGLTPFGMVFWEMRTRYGSAEETD